MKNNIDKETQNSSAQTRHWLGGDLKNNTVKIKLELKMKEK